jgi:hypothetical protein
MFDSGSWSTYYGSNVNRQWKIKSIGQNNVWGQPRLSFISDYTDDERMVINMNDGNVGIGTATPGYRLDVAGEIRSSTGGFRFPDGTVQTTAASGSGSQWTGSGSISYSGGNVGIGTSTPADTLHVNGLIVGGFGARTTSGVQNWNDISNTRPGSGYSLLLGNHPNGPGPGLYYHPFSFEYASKDGSGNVTQFAIPYGHDEHMSAGLFMRGRYDGSWGPWHKILAEGSSGRVGIGTTQPAAQLSINQDTDVQATLRLSNNGINGREISIKSAASGVNGSIVQSNTGADFEIGNVSGALSLRTNNANRFYVTNGGYVGIGTTEPTKLLHVQGDGRVTGNLTVDGSLNAKYQDVAEWVPASEQLSAGTVVVLDATKSNQVTSSTVSYDTRAAGVVSEQPGITLGEKGENKVLVATTGRVRVKVDATKSPIHIGDLLVTSDVPGVAMKSEPVNLGGVQFHRPGTLIGKALEPLEKGKGEILVLLSLQ